MKVTDRLKGLRPPTGRKASLAVAVTTVVALAAVVWQALAWNDHRRGDDRREAAIEVARAQVVDLTTLDSSTIDAKLAAMGKRLSGEFKRQFEGFAQTFAEVVDADRIRATGEVKSVAVDHIDVESASVLVATSASVAHGKAKKTSQKDYRVRVDLDREGDAWLITGMEFVG